jgi:hypothetical protein
MDAIRLLEEITSGKLILAILYLTIQKMGQNFGFQIVPMLHQFYTKENLFYNLLLNIKLSRLSGQFQNQTKCPVFKRYGIRMAGLT